MFIHPIALRSTPYFDLKAAATFAELVLLMLAIGKIVLISTDIPGSMHCPALKQGCFTVIR